MQRSLLFRLCCLVACVISVAHARGSLLALSPTPVAEETPAPEDIVVSGQIYHAWLGPEHGISGATVSVCTSLPRCFPATAGLDGKYSLRVPAMYAALVDTIRVWAPGYVSLEEEITAQELRDHPERDYVMTPLPRVWMPLVLRNRAAPLRGELSSAQSPSR